MLGVTVLLQVLLGLGELAGAQDQTVAFSVIGDAPYGEAEVAVVQDHMNNHNRYSPSDFLVHVGDIFAGGESCEAAKYERMADILKSLAIPAFILPGDNEWVDCDDPDQAWVFWETHLLAIETNFCGTPAVERQAIRHENFAFTHKGVLFIGINLVSGSVNATEGNLRMQHDADWVSQHLQDKGSLVRAAVIFSQAGPSSNRNLFFDQFRTAASAFGKPVLFIHGDGHSWRHDQPFPEPNIVRVQVPRGDDPPVQVTVTLDPQNMFVFDLDPWPEGTEPLNLAPCVEAGPDQRVMLGDMVYLDGLVTDDGEPTVPGTVTTTWSQVSGPGMVSFADASSPVTTATVNIGGTYELRLTANDGELVGSAELTLEVLGTGPMITINDVTVTEGNAGTVAAVFIVRLVNVQGQTVEVGYATADGTAQAGSDYTAASGSVTLSDTTPAQTITVLVHGDTTFEGDETFVVNLSTTSSVPIARQGIGTIRNDDAPPPPRISAFSPTRGPVGTEVTISGQYFTGGIAVAFNGTAASSVTVDSDTQLWARVPTGATTGLIRVTNPGGSGLSSAPFVVTTPPDITAVTPAGGPLGATVTVTGRYFTSTTAVTFNGTPAAFTVVTDSELRTTVPTDATSGLIQVTNADGSGFSPEPFTVQAPPVITTITPTSGPVGTAVTLTGRRFTGTTEVTFEGTPAAFTVLSDTELRTTVPANATTGRLYVTTAYGTGESPTDFTVTRIFTPLADAQVNSAEPSRNFGTVTTLRAKQDSTTYRSYLQFQVSGAGHGVQRARLRLYVTDASDQGGALYSVASTYAGTTTSWTEAGLTWANAPVLSGPPLSSLGAVSTNTWVEFDVTAAILGDGTYSFGLHNSSTNSVYYSSKEGAQPPELVIETLPVPEITAFTPASGPVGTAVTLMGRHFTGTSEVTFNGTPAAFTVGSDTELQTTVPPGASTGLIHVTNVGGTDVSATDFLVIVPPVLTAFTPSRGPVGTAVTLTGTGFTGITAVTFNGTPAAFTVVSDTELRTTVPAGATTGPLQVTNAAGTTVSPDLFTVLFPPEITVFTPTSGPWGTPVTLTGRHFSSTSEVTFNGTPAAFTVGTDSELRTTVPAGATPGLLQVTNTDGTGVSPAPFTALPPPTITAITPARGPAGTLVTLLGRDFTGTLEVTFNGTSAAFTVGTDSELRTAVPADATTGPLAVTNGGGTSASPDPFTVLLLPEITTVTPPSGPRGALVTLTGRHFTGTTAVTFNGTPAPFTVGTDTELRTTVPPDAIAGPIHVTNTDGTGLNPALFTVLLPPTITTVTPASGPVGTVVTLHGRDFTGTTAVTFNGTPAAFTVLSDTELRTTVPAGATTGPLQVTNGGGTGVSPSDFTLTVLFLPLADAQVKSSEASRNFGTLTTLQVKQDTTTYHSYLQFQVSGVGSDVHRARLRLYVTNASNDGGALYSVANTYAGTTTPWTEAGLTWNNAPALSGTPLSAVGVVSTNTWVEVDVTAALLGDGTYSFGLRSSSTDAVIYSAREGTRPPELVIETLPPAPQITAFTPASGPVGTAVTLTGRHFTGTLEVTFNGTPAAFTVASDTELHTTVPPDASTGPIEVTNTDGVGESATDFLVIVPPVLTAFTPSRGPVGTAVTLTGTGFTGITAVTFNGTPAAFTVVSDTELRTTVPAGATTGPLQVTNAAGTSLSTASFVVTTPPQLTEVTPASGPIGTVVTLTGRYFTSTTAVTFNGTLATFTVVSDTELRTTVPAGATTGPLQVTNTDGAGVSPSPFTVLLPPTITTVTPTSGPAGTAVILRGRDFTGTTAVTFNGIPAAFTVVSDTELHTTVPPDAPSGPLQVTNGGGTGVSPDPFTVLLLPEITAVTPASGPHGTPVTVTGRHFTGTTAVAFNGIPAAFTVVSDTDIQATVPSDATTGPLQVTNADGTGGSPGPFTVLLPPTITTVTPTSGPVGTLVTLRGRDFTGTTAITFNGTPATFTVVGDTELRTTVPVGATTGPLQITSGGGTGVSPTDFTITVIFTPTADAQVSSSDASRNFGTVTTLRAKQDSTTYRSYLQFKVSGVGHGVQRARLRLYVTDASDQGGALYSVANTYAGTTTSWTEAGLTWANAPVLSGTPLSSLGAVSTNTWVEFDVTAAILGDGTYSFGLRNSSTNSVYYSSKEGAQPPALIIETRP